MPFVGPNGIDLSIKQTLAWKLLTDATTRKLFMGGGAGSLKSTTGCLWQIWARIQYPGTRGFIGRDTYKELRDSTMATFFQILTEMKYRPGVDYTYNAQDENVYWKNGSETHFRYMQYKPSDPDFHRFGSTEYTDGLVDEAPGVDKRAVQVLESRLRFKHVEYNLIPKLMLTGNPGDHWIKEDFVYDKNGNPVVLPPHVGMVLATIHDHPDKEFREKYIETLMKLDPYDRARLMDGDWLVGPRTGREFFWEFSTSKNVGDRYPYDPNKPVQIGFDFNAAPYMTLVVFQFHKVGIKYVMQGLKEYCLEHPLATTESVCRALQHDLLDGDFKGHKAGLFYYGDYSGKNRSSMERDGIAHNYDTVEVILGKHMTAASCQVMPNPLHVRVCKWMNHVFKGSAELEIVLSPKMSNTVRDFSLVKMDVNGSMLKEKDRDGSEKYGHCSQATYYIACSAFNAQFMAYVG